MAEHMWISPEEYSTPGFPKGSSVYSGPKHFKKWARARGMPARRRRIVWLHLARWRSSGRLSACSTANHQIALGRALSTRCHFSLVPLTSNHGKVFVAWPQQPRPAARRLLEAALETASTVIPRAVSDPRIVEIDESECFSSSRNYLSPHTCRRGQVHRGKMERRPLLHGQRSVWSTQIVIFSCGISGGNFLLSEISSSQPGPAPSSTGQVRRLKIQMDSQDSTRAGNRPRHERLQHAPTISE